MSSRDRNIALLQAGLEAFNRDDQDAVVRYFDSEIEARVGPGLVNSGTFHGHDGYREMVGSWNEAWGEIVTSVVSVDALDDHHVIAEIDQTATGNASGVPVRMTVFYFLEVRNEKAVRFHIYADREAALAAVAG